MAFADCTVHGEISQNKNMGLDPRVIFEPGFWQEVNIHLYHLVAKRDETAVKLLATARAMLYAMEEISGNSAGFVCEKQTVYTPTTGVEGVHHPANCRRGKPLKNQGGEEDLTPVKGVQGDREQQQQRGDSARPTGTPWGSVESR